MDRRTYLKQLSAIGLALSFPAELISGVPRKKHDREICKREWESLCGSFSKRFEFRYIDPQKKLPNIFLYGDSISIGYTEYVRESFEGKASVFRLHKNGGASGSFIDNMEVLRNTMFQPTLKDGWNFDWDLIHFNVGLHDLKYIYEGKLDKKNGKQVSTLKEYESNLISIIDYLNLSYPKAKLVFATTTPVPEGEPGRIIGDDIRYNEIALKVMHRYNNIFINDLYTFSLPVIDQFAAGPGNVHYNDEGKRIQGIEVARVIGEVLGIQTNTCPSFDEVKTKFESIE